MDKEIEFKPDAAGRANGRERWSYRPRVDVAETSEAVTVVVDVPGAGPEDVDVGFEGGILRIHGRVPSRQPAEADYLMHEYGVGDFDRDLVLRQAIDAEGISAECDHGVLRIRLPRAAEALPRRIPIRSAE